MEGILFGIYCLVVWALILIFCPFVRKDMWENLKESWKELREDCNCKSYEKKPIKTKPPIRDPVKKMR